MTFNARWKLQDLSTKKGLHVRDLLVSFLADIEGMIASLPVHQLSLKSNETAFEFLDADGDAIAESGVYDGAGFYLIFSGRHVVYVGEAENLRRRQFVDPDGTADSNKLFGAQGRAILKYLMKEAIESALNLGPLFVQLYPGCQELDGKAEKLEVRYRLDKKDYRECLEGFLSLVAGSFHPCLRARAQSQGYHL